MAKVRVYEVAREVGVPNKELVERIAAMGISVRNHMSVLEPEEVERVRRVLAASERAKDNLVEERIRPTVVRRRAKKKAPEAPLASADGAASAAESVPAEGAPVEKGTSVPHATEESASARAVDASVPVEASTARVDPVKQDEVKEPALAATGDQVQAQGVDSEVSGGTATTAPDAQTPPPAAKDGSAPTAEDTEPERDNTPWHEVEQPMPQRSTRRGALPPGVVARGNVVAPAAKPISDAARRRIVSEHASKRPDGGLRRRELGRAALGPVGRNQARGSMRPARRKLTPGKKGKQTEITVPSAQKRVIRIEDNIQLQSLAQRMSLKATEVLMKLMQLGMANVHINSALDTDTAKILAGEFGYEVENVAQSTEDIVKAARGEFEDAETDQIIRPPIVTVMGHVDHGKTSLLDRIRSADVAAREAGGITQHIGAYRVETKKGPVVFLDTPGHEAFTSMRARGAHATDVVILVVAADDGIMPQTKEAISHARAAEVPIVVAVNKIDRPDAKPDQIRNELAAEGLQPEEWGGDTMVVNCSAVTGEGVEDILENVVLQAEVLELKANESIPAEGVVLEAYLDKGRGPVGNVLVRSGTLKAGDAVVAGGAWGRVRALTDDRGKIIRAALPSTPVEVLGFTNMPVAGDPFYVVQDQKKAQEVAEAHSGGGQTGPTIQSGARGLERIHEMMQAGDVHELKLVVKADVQGSIEALSQALTNLATEKVKVNVIHTGVGGVTENDVMLASASQAIIVGFNVRPAGQAAATAKKEGVDVRMYRVIYEAVDEVKAAMTGMLAPKLVEKDLGKAEVRQVFNIPKVGAVAGCYVTDGKIVRSAHARLVRDSVAVWQGRFLALKRFKDDAREVASGYECGISLEQFNDIKENDVIECFDMEEVAASLD